MAQDITEEQMVQYLQEGNDPYDLAMLYINKLTSQEKEDLKREITDYQISVNQMIQKG